MLAVMRPRPEIMQAIREFLAQNADTAQEFSLRVLAGVKTGGLIIVSVLINLALIPVVMFYVLRDWNMLLLRLDELLPRAWRGKAKTIARDIDAVLAEFLRGQVLVMFVLACYYAISLKIAGLDRALSIGILTGLLIFIPYVGFGLGLVRARRHSLHDTEHLRIGVSGIRSTRSHGPLSGRGSLGCC